MRIIIFTLLALIFTRLNGQEIADHSRYCYHSTNTTIYILGYKTHFRLGTQMDVTFTSFNDTLKYSVYGVRNDLLFVSVNFTNPGIYDISVSNDSDGVITISNGLTVSNSPTYYFELDSLSSHLAGDNGQIDVTVFSTVQDTFPKFTPACFVNIKNDSIQVDSFSYLNPNRYRLYFNIPATSNAGYYTLLVKNNPDTIYHLYDAILVKNSNSTQIDSVTPSRIFEFIIYNAKIYGHKTHFTNNTQVYYLPDSTWDFNIVNDSLITFKWFNMGPIKSLYNISLTLYNPTDGLLEFYPIILYTSNNNGFNYNFKSHTNIRIFPNPAQTHINFDFGDETQNIKHLNIFNIAGQNLISLHNISAHEPIDIQSLKAGVYFIKLESDEGLVFSGKFVKQ